MADRAGFGVRADALEAEGHELISRGHAKLAEAAAARAAAPTSGATKPSWIPPAESPLGKKATLALHRARAVESAKIGRRVLIRRRSLEAYIAAHEAGAGATNGNAVEHDEDLFGASTRRAS